MTSFQSPNGAAVWSERVGSGVGRAVEEMHWVLSGGEFILEEVSAGNPEDGRAVDWHGDGAEYELVHFATPYVIIDVGGGVLKPASSGTPAAILVDDDGGLLTSTDLSLAEAGAWFLTASGRLVPVRFDAPVQRFVKIGDQIQSFE